MPINIRQNTIRVRHANGEYGSIDAVTEETVAERVAAIEAAGAAVASDIEDLGQDVRDSIPQEYSALSDDVTELKSEMSTAQSAIRRLSLESLSLDAIHDIVAGGDASKYFDYGDQLNLNYKNGTTDYVLPWDVVQFGNFELQDGSTKPGMVIQSHYAMQGVQFSASQAAWVCETALAPGTYHFTIGTTWGSNCVSGKVYQFTTTEEVPVGGQIVFGKNNDFYTWGAPDQNPTNWRVFTFSSNTSITPLDTLTMTEGSDGTDLGTMSSTIKFGASGLGNLQSCAYGYNRWSHSANRQFYNSSADAGSWWTPQHDADRPPQQHGSVQGFMKGFEDEFLSIINPVKVTTALNTVTDSDIGTSETTYDTFWLPSLEQEYIVPQLAGVEGEFFPYWKERLGLSSPQATGAANANENHIRYAFDAKTSAQFCRLRSAYRTYAYSTWYVFSTGGAYGYGTATHAYRGCPACVII